MQANRFKVQKGLYVRCFVAVYIAPIVGSVF